ncbi:tetratricopeptide repeat protein [Deinococcus sp. SL84]|uniref:tetratricopeptide repeat protein n=1 Tax=Deinococcus sp. SL84 TaxID=2994663 RepID=UPI002275B1E0|nr:tetratricopeptide repeat protein [Deinococcus sp. SL84]MCY1702446.1 tetratricopeptide repeat protein [Deinococcus sp. SL84]
MKLTPSLTLALALGASLWGAGAAQTLIDTSAAVGVSGTLNSISGPSPSVIPQVRERLDAVLDPSAQVTVAGEVAPAPAIGSPAAAQPGTTQPVTAQPSAGQPAPAPALTAEQLSVLQAAYTALEQGNAAQARQGFEQLISQNYRHPEAHFGLALALLAQGQTEAARFELGQLTALAPDRYEGPYNLGVLAVQAGQYPEALTYFGQAATLARTTASEDGQLYVLRALAAEQSRAADYAGLRQTLGEMVALDPGNAELKLRLAQAQTLTGEGVAALPGTYEALGSTRTQADAALLLSDIYEAQGLPERGLSELDRALQSVTAEDERARLLLRRARLLDALGQSAAAITAAEQSVRLRGNDAAAFALLGDLRRGAGNSQGALQAYREAALLEPKNADYRTELAALRLGLGRYADARRDAGMALNMNASPVTQARAELVLGLLDYRSARYASASTALRSSAAKLPSAETYLWLGLSEYKQKNYAGAAEALSESVRLDPTPLARRNLGSALLAAGRAAEAEALLLGLVTETPGDAEAWYLLGLARRADGKAAEARAAFQSAAALGSTAARGALK